MMGKLRALGALVAMSGLSLIPMSLTGSAAYGASDYNGAQYQVEFSLNCTSTATLCYQEHGLGGIWGWMALMPDHSGNAQVTLCGHSSGGSGAGHMSFDPTWTIITLPPFVEAGLPAIDPNHQYIVLIAGTDGLEIPPFPATPGHYALNPALGAEGSVTVAPPSGV